MNALHTFKHWTEDHNMHWLHLSDLKLASNKLIHNPLFWLMVALIAFVAMMIVLGYFAGGNGGEMPDPYYPYRTGPWWIFP